MNTDKVKTKNNFKNKYLNKYSVVALDLIGVHLCSSAAKRL
jgi:hypothetical protein